MRQPLDKPLYYLDNFERVLAWVGEHHDDLLEPAERAVLHAFPSLPQASRALLVRLAMRKGCLFRASRLDYPEIGCPRQAMAPLCALGWVEEDPLLELDALFALFTLDELRRALPGGARRRKGDWRADLRAQGLAPRRAADWGLPAEPCYALRLEAFCQRLRLMFFGNLHQDWSAFVLADLGIHRYESVPFSPGSRAFQSRRELDDYLHLHACREAFEAGEPALEVLARLPSTPFASPWLESRRGKLLLKLGLQLERDGALEQACEVHAGNDYPGARARQVRVLERLGRSAAALALAEAAAQAPESEEEAQQLARCLPRLRRAAGQAAPRNRRPGAEATFTLSLPRPDDGRRVEWAVRDHLHEAAAPVHYVENGLLNSLFGLLCWEAIFAPLPGAFFHPYHAAPADLDRGDFVARRAALFDACLARLDSGEYRACIRRTWAEKHGRLSPFVHWELLGPELLALALDCLPAEHLRHCFQRLLHDLKGNRAGLPDLIQFWPAERRYRMIEVKGPGDRLQDNQLRWIAHAERHGLPIAVCHVQWAPPA